MPTEEEARATDGPRYLPRMRASYGKDALDGSGIGGVPGFLQPAGMALIVRHLRDRCRMRGPNAIFCDVGCGQGRPMLAALEASPRLGGVLGLDVDPTVLLLARAAFDKFARLRWTGGGYVLADAPIDAPRHCLARADIAGLEDLGCVTHAYCFCYGMPGELIAHLLRVCAATRTLRYLVLVYKPAAGDFAKAFVEAVHARTPCHFFRKEDGRSALGMPGGTVPHGCCIRVSDAVRALMREAAEGTPRDRPHVEVDCFA